MSRHRQSDRAGLPTIAKVYAEAAVAASRVPGRAAAEPRLAAIRLKLIATGAALHRIPDFDATVADPCPTSPDAAPLIGDADCNLLSFGASPLDMAESEFLHECHERYGKVLRSALRAARRLKFEFTDFVY